MSGKTVFDAEASRNLEAVYRTPDVVRQRGETLSALGLQPGEAQGVGEVFVAEHVELSDLDVGGRQPGRVGDAGGAA